MYILGLNIGHNGTAALLKDGKIIGCISEERFSRIKNHSGFPIVAINYLLKENKITLKDVDYITLDKHYLDHPLEKDHLMAKRMRENYVNQKKFKKIISFIAYKYPNLIKFYRDIKKSIKPFYNKNHKNHNFFNSVERILKGYGMEMDKKKFLFLDHHLSHALATCFNLNKKEKTLIFTLDGEGSGVCATINVWDGNKISVISRSKKDASLGYLYGIITMCLGMKPLEHEFKVMGLAPYAKRDKVEELYNKKFKNLIWVNDNLEFESRFDMIYSDKFYIHELKFERFDNIAGAVQKLTEDLTQEWIRKAIKKTDIHNVALSGGVFMNVKANQKIYEMPEVKNLFVMPSCGDEVNAIGACFYGYKKYCEENNLKFDPKPIKDLYLGPEYNDEYIKNLIKSKNLSTKYKIKKIKKINKEVAKLLARGEIVARCSGRSEWGARALGNRSILANAKNTDTIRILNETIKDRDFWMPFTPSILDKYEKEYVINPKNMFAPYMCITFNSTEKAKKDIPAALHPYDFTLRPQIVTKDYNPDYYEIIEEFSKLTGIGGILNTSFNLHGEPNVLTPEDALHTVENSDLKYLAMGNYLFEKINL